jgi:hypothetical protein
MGHSETHRLTALTAAEVSFNEPSAHRRITLSPVLFHKDQHRPQNMCVLAEVVYLMPFGYRAVLAPSRLGFAVMTFVNAGTLGTVSGHRDELVATLTQRNDLLRELGCSVESPAVIPGCGLLITVQSGPGKGMYEFVACVHVELRVDTRDVGLHGSLSDVQLLSDRLRSEALGRKGCDLALPIGERGGAKESGARTPARLAEVVEVREDLVAAPSVAACHEQFRRAA